MPSPLRPRRSRARPRRRLPIRRHPRTRRRVIRRLPVIRGPAMLPPPLPLAFVAPGLYLRGDAGAAFRADITASYLPSLHFSGGDNIGAGSANTARIHSWVGLVNAYFDFPVLTIFGPMEPYLDVGLGGGLSS